MDNAASANSRTPAYICHPWRVIPPELQLLTLAPGVSVPPILRSGDKMVKANPNGAQEPASSISPIPFLRTALRLEYRHAERNRTASRTEAAMASSQSPFCREAA